MHYEALEQLTRDRRAARAHEAEAHRLATAAGTHERGALRRTLAAGLERLHQRRRPEAGLRQHA